LDEALWDSIAQLMPQSALGLNRHSRQIGKSDLSFFRPQFAALPINRQKFYGLNFPVFWAEAEFFWRDFFGSLPKHAEFDDRRGRCLF